MPEQEIYNNFQSHWDDDNDWNPAETGSGDDNHTFTVPTGKRFSRVQLDIEANTAFSNASISQSPAANATGGLSAKVHWAFNPFGKIAYRLKAFATDASTPSRVTVNAGPFNWPQPAIDALNQRLPLTVQLQGPDAVAFMNALRRAKNQLPLPPTANIVVVDDVTAATIISVAAILAAVAIVTLLVICIICLYAISKNYHVKVDYKRNGPLPYDDQLSIILDPI